MPDRCRERQTVQVAPGAQAFKHETLIDPYGMVRNDHPPKDAALLIATCITQRPQRRCDCGIFDVAWSDRA